MFEKLEGIVLRARDYGETHKIVSIFTREHGKISVIAKGAKKTKSRTAAITQPFIHASFLVQVSKNLGTLNQGEIISSMRSIREDIIKTAYAAYVTELTEKICESNQADPFLFQQLLETLNWMTEEKDIEILTMVYELKMFKKGGFAPELRYCVNCSKQNEEHYHFSILEGGILCSRCRINDPNSVQLHPKLIRMLYVMMHLDIAKLGDISVKQENKQKIITILDEYYDRYGGYYLKSKKFLKQLSTFNLEK